MQPQLNIEFIHCTAADSQTQFSTQVHVLRCTHH